jgi:glycosyltransferase involved in cell wall biosynthesis
VRILVVCDFLFKYGAQQARALAQLGHDVRMLCRSHALEFGGRTAERDEWIASLGRDGVGMLVVPGRIRSMRAVPAMLEIRQALRRWDPQIVHVHENHDPRLLALTTGYRTVLTVHDPLGHPGAPELTSWENWAFRRWFRRAERFIVHGQALVEELEPLVRPRPIVVIPHGSWVRPKPLPPPPSPTVLLFGRLEQYKGVEILVEAMRLVWTTRPEARLVVAGAGEAARLVPSEPRISLVPRYISESEVGAMLAEASLVALPYTQASQCGVGQLAIAAGVPVVVSDLGALPELTYDPSFVFEAGNARALAETIERHLDDDAGVRDAVLRHAQSRFSWRHAARMTSDLYLQLTTDNGWAPVGHARQTRPLGSSAAGLDRTSLRMGTSAQTTLVDIGVAEFADAFARRSVAVRHDLAHHPLFAIDAIAELADRLPPDSVRRERGKLPLANYGKYMDVGEGPPSETIKNVERTGTRVSLRDIQQVPDYAELIDACLDEVEPLVAERQGGMTARAGYLFISCSNSTTPMHFDREHSFLLQVQGVKHVSVAAFDDDPAALQRQFDCYVDGRECDFAAMQRVAETFTIEPGVGVYLPSYVPHWVETEAGISISFSIPFDTKYVERAEAVIRINKRLRRLHLSPRPIGASEPIDRAKAAVVRSLTTLDKLRA